MRNRENGSDGCQGTRHGSALRCCGNVAASTVRTKAADFAVRWWRKGEGYQVSRGGLWEVSRYVV